jgi:hypothetical protein
VIPQESLRLYITNDMFDHMNENFPYLASRKKIKGMMMKCVPGEYSSESEGEEDPNQNRFDGDDGFGWGFDDDYEKNIKAQTVEPNEQQNKTKKSQTMRKCCIRFRLTSSNFFNCLGKLFSMFSTVLNFSSESN